MSTAPQRPPDWAAITSHPEFSALAPAERQALADRWGNQASEFIAKQPGVGGEQLVELLGEVKTKVDGWKASMAETAARDDAQRRLGDLTPADRGTETGISLMKGLATAGNSMVDSAAKIGQRIPVFRMLGLDERYKELEEDSADLQEHIDRYYQQDERFQGTLNDNLAGGAATLASMAVPGAAVGKVTKSVGLARAAAAFAGASLEATSQYRDAVAAGADEDTAMKAWALGGAIGTTDSLPVFRPLRNVLDKIDKASGGAFRKAVKEAAIGGVTEAAQEYFQTSAGNLVAQKLYDENRELLDGAGDASEAGGILGAVMGAVSTVGNRRIPGGRRAGSVPSAEQGAATSVPPVDSPTEVRTELRADQGTDTAARPVSTDVPQGAGMTFDLTRPAAAEAEPVPQAEVEAATEPTTPPSPEEARRPQNLGPGAANAAQFKPRKFPARAFDDERLAQRVRDMGSEDSYIPISNQDTQDQVNEKLAEMGPVPAAVSLMGDEQVMDPRLRVALGQQVVLRLSQSINQAEAAGNTEQAHELALLSDDLIRDIGALGTELGQGVQAFAMWNRMTPEGILKRWHKTRGEDAEPLTGEEAAEIASLQDTARKAPHGSFIHEEVNRRLLDRLAAKDGVPVMDFLTSFWYSNVLSGAGTHAINIAGSGQHLLARVAARGLVSHPRDFAALVGGMLDAQGQAAEVAKQAVTKGRPVAKTDRKFQQSNALEQVASRAKHWYSPSNLFTLGRFVTRTLTAEDAWFYTTAREGMAAAAASKVARRRAKEEGITYDQAMAEELHNSTAEWQAAEAQARADVTTVYGENHSEGDVVRRTYEILDSRRSEEVRAEADRWGDLITYTNRPEGSFGVLADSVNRAVRGAALPVGKGQFEPIRFAVPFVNIVANVASTGVDFTPLGYVRAARGRHIFGRSDASLKWGRQERLERAATATIGTAAMGFLAYLAEQYIDDDDPQFAVYGWGPPDSTKRSQMRTEGWQPFTIKIGDRYIRYNDTVLAPMLATLGGIHDLRRFGKPQPEADGVNWEAVAYAVKLYPSALLDQSFLSGVKGLFENLDARRHRSLASEAGRTLSGFVPGQGLLRDIAKISDPGYVDVQTLREAIIKDIPVIQRWGTRKMLNLWGEPVEAQGLQRLPVVSRFVSGRTTDPDTRFLAEHRLWVPGMGNEVTVSWQMLKPPEDATDAESARFQAGVESAQANRERELGRIAAGVFTDDEHYEYVQRSGQHLRKGIGQLRSEFAAGQWTEDELQDRVKLTTTAARRLAKKEMLEAMARKFAR